MKYLVRLALVLLTYNTTAQIEKQIDSLLAPYNIKEAPGLSVRVLQNNQILYSKNYGLSNLDYPIKNSDSTIYSIASISKQFTAAAAWHLITQDKLNLEDDIRTYLPELPDYGSVIKIKHLFNHTSGIRGYHTLMYLSGFDYDTIYYDNHTVFNLACQQQHLNNIPGAKVIYSNTNYNLLALIIEKISNTNLDAYLKTNILQPLGMNHTFVRISQGSVIKNKAVGYQKKEGVYKYNVTNQLSYGAGSMGSSLIDMAKWVQVLNGNIPEFSNLTAFLKTQEFLPNNTLAKYARGVMIDDYKGNQTVSHSGYGFGGQSQLITIPEQNIGVIIFTNLQSINPTPISYQILDLILPEKLMTNTKREKYKIEHQLNSFVGDFKEVNSDMKMTFTLQHDTLQAKSSFGKFPVPLIATGNGNFVRKNSQNIKYDFVFNEEADLIIYFGGTPFYFKRAHFIKPETVNVHDFIGKYYSEELKTTYTFSVKDKKLVLSYKNNPNIKLAPVQRNEFGNNNRTLYRFNTTKTKLFLSCDGAVKDIIFKKSNP